MSATSNPDQDLQRAVGLYEARRFTEADAVLTRLLAAEPTRREALELAVMLALQRGDADTAIAHLQGLNSAYPDEPVYCDRLASLLERRDRRDEALGCYRRILASSPGLVVSRCNYAGLLRRCGEDEAALTQYRRCLADDIDRAEEVLSNIGSILADLHRQEEAEEALTRALDLRPGFVPALYNLALLRQERGDATAAGELLQHVLAVQPAHAEALARLAEIGGDEAQSRKLLGQMAPLWDDPRLPAASRESLGYARGKLLDDLGEYPAAFASYAQANRLSRARVGTYPREQHAALIDRLVAGFDRVARDGAETVSDAPLIFICGMFRSGSTLLEQMLGSHPGLTAGGEIDFFQRRLPLSQVADDAGAAERRTLGTDYLAHIDAAFGTQAITNKRPDNDLYLGFLHTLYPNARFIYTQRQPADNGLSVFFQQLDARFPYANDLSDIAHYMNQQQRLMTAWRDRFGDRITAVQYEALVTRPRETLEPVLGFLGLPWAESCLDYTRLENRVRTASVAQVRRPLYRSACDRWRNYERELRPLLDGMNPVAAD